MGSFPETFNDPLRATWLERTTKKNLKKKMASLKVIC